MLSIMLAETDPEIMRDLHAILVSLQESSLAKEGKLRVIVHFKDNKILEPAREVDLENLEFKKGTFDDALYIAKPDKIVVMSPDGKDSLDVFSKFNSKENILVVVGGFTEGDLSENVYKHADYVVSLSKDLLKIWTVVNEVVAEYEKNLKG